MAVRRGSPFGPGLIRFLRDLEAHNNRDWFLANKERYEEEVREPALAFIHAMAPRLTQVSRHLVASEKKVGGSLMRIYKDTRFSKDKTPYQPHFAGSFSRLGKELRGGYYLRVRPGESFLAGGFWSPNSADLFRIRKEFELDDGPIRKILDHKNFTLTFGSKLEGEELKTAPRGFDKMDPNMDLIRKKGFVAVRRFTNKEVLADDFLEVIDESFGD